MTSAHSQIRLLVLDVDGVLTRGEVIYSSSGEELKAFNIHDGLGLVRALDHGIVTAIITGRNSPMVARRAKELRIAHVVQGARDKLQELTALCQQYGASFQDVAYMGDDLPDLCVLEKVGLACCPADAVDEVKAVCHMIAQRKGGEGAVRELCDLLVAGRRSLTTESPVSL